MDDRVRHDDDDDDDDIFHQINILNEYLEIIGKGINVAHVMGK